MSIHDQLWYAANVGNADKVSRLLALGANPNQIPVVEGHITDDGNYVYPNIAEKDEPSGTPLMNAIRKGYTEVVRVLLDSPDIDIYATDDVGSTALHIAAEIGHEEIVNLLLAKYSPGDIFIEDNYGNKPATLALEQGYRAIASRIQQKQFEIKIATIEPIHVGDRIKVHVIGIDNPCDCTVVDVGPCRWEVTETKLMEFYNRLENINKAESTDPALKEALQFLYPSMYPAEEAVTALSAGNLFQSKPALMELLRTLNSGMDVMARRAKLAEITTFPEYSARVLKLVRRAYDVIKRSQVIKVEFDTNPGVFGYYVAYDCSKSDIHFIAEKYMTHFDDYDVGDDGITPSSNAENIIHSTLPAKYTLVQTTEINSWINHGLLSLYLLRPDVVKSVCTHPLVGDDDFWRYVQGMMERQFDILHSISRPIDREIEVYRGSPFFKTHAVRKRFIFATSKEFNIANTFTPNRVSKLITLPPGTRILDLSDINKHEQEILVFPKARDTNMVIEPVNLKNPLKSRNTYRIRNVNETRNKNLPRSRRGRRQTRRRR